MKIGYLISNYLPKIGGAEAFTHKVATELTKQGHYVVVVTPSRGRKFDDLFRYKIERINPLLTRILFVNFKLGKIYVERLLSGLQKKHGFDIWQVIIGYPLGIAAVDFFIKNKIPCVLRCSGEDIQVAPEIKYGYRLNRNADRLIRENYRKFTAFAANSNSMKREYLSLGIPEEKIKVIPNGVDCIRFRAAADKEKIKRELGLKDGQKLILTVGRNHPKKGFKYIPQMIRRLTDKGLDFKWLLVGKDSLSIKLLADKEGMGMHMVSGEELKPGISKNGELEIPPDKLVQYYKAADIFVFPTFLETFGIVLLDAMAAGLPIVTTNVPGVSDTIRNNENGLMGKAGDVEGLTGSIMSVLSDSRLAQHLREGALKDADKYDWVRIADSYLELYKKTLGAR